MSVYVDDMDARYGRMLMSHMAADSRAELDAMADVIGVARRWIQHPGTWREHYDISLGKKRLAIAHGALPVTQRRLVGLMQSRGKEQEARS